MKKILIVIFSICVFFMFNLCNVQASEYDDYDVGKTVNLVTNNLGSFSVNNNYYVFDMNRLYTDFDIVSRNNISEVLISEQIEKNSMDFFKSYSISCGVSGEISAYSNNIYLSNTLSFSSTLHNYSFSGFYSYKKITKNRVDSLSNLLNDMSSYYCQEFLTACNNAYYTKNEDDYFRIFDNYGTHIILSAVYGHKLEKNAYCASNESTLYSFVDNQFSATMSSSDLYGEVNVNLSSSLNTSVGINKYISNIYIYETTGIIPTYENKIVPIWEYLSIEMQEEMNAMLKRYSAKKNSQLGVVSTQFEYFPSEKVITDSGRFNQDKNCIIIDDVYRAYYTKVSIKIIFEARQIDKGNSFVFLYSGNEDGPQGDQLNIANDLGLAKGQPYKICAINEDVLIDDLDEAIWILYGATGLGDDDWQKKNVKVYLEFRND